MPIVVPRLEFNLVSMPPAIGPQGNAGYSCRMFAKLSSGERPIETEVQGGNLQAVVTYGLNVASRTIERQLISRRP